MSRPDCFAGRYTMQLLRFYPVLLRRRNSIFPTRFQGRVVGKNLCLALGKVASNCPCFYIVKSLNFVFYIIYLKTRWGTWGIRGLKFIKYNAMKNLNKILFAVSGGLLLGGGAVLAYMQARP